MLNLSQPRNSSSTRQCLSACSTARLNRASSRGCRRRAVAEPGDAIAGSAPHRLQRAVQISPSLLWRTNSVHFTKKTNIHIDHTQAVACRVCSCGCHCTTFSCSSYPTQAHFRLSLIILAHYHVGKLSGYCAIIISEVTQVSLPLSFLGSPSFVQCCAFTPFS